MIIRKILVPLDGSELTLRAIHASIGLAQQLNATLIGFIASSQSGLPTELRRSALSETFFGTEDGESSQVLDQVLASFADAAAAAGVDFQVARDRVLPINDAIVAAAESHGCDLILMVTHGRGAFGEFLFGSHTKAVLGASKLPLLVLH